MCQDTEKMMSIFSEELAIMDKNTVQYMVDEMQDTIDSLQNDNSILKNTNSTLQNEILMLKEKLKQYEKTLCKNNPT